MTNRELLQSISGLLDEKLAQQNHRMDLRFAEQKKYIDDRFSEEREYVDKRFEEQKEYVDKRFEEQKEYVDKRFEEQKECFEKQLEDRLEEKTHSLMNSILEEVDFVQEKANDHFKRIEKRLDNLEITVRTIKTDSDTILVLVDRMSNLEKRVERLERKIS